jgi:hypothetical protein
MQRKFEIMRIKESVNPQDFSTAYLVQIAVDGKPCTPFWSPAEHRKTMGEDAWVASLKENAEHMLMQFGPAPAMA